MVKMLVHGLRGAIIGTIPLGECPERLRACMGRLNEPPRRRALQMLNPLS